MEPCPGTDMEQLITEANGLFALPRRVVCPFCGKSWAIEDASQTEAQVPFHGYGT